MMAALALPYMGHTHVLVAPATTRQLLVQLLHHSSLSSWIALMIYELRDTEREIVIGPSPPQRTATEAACFARTKDIQFKALD